MPLGPVSLKYGLKVPTPVSDACMLAMSRHGRTSRAMTTQDFMFHKVMFCASLVVVGVDSAAAADCLQVAEILFLCYTISTTLIYL